LASEKHERKQDRLAEQHRQSLAHSSLQSRDRAFEMGLISLAAVAAGIGHIAMNEGYRYLPVATGASTQMALPVMLVW